MKVYYCYSRDNRKIIVRAASKKAAEERTGIPAAILAVCHDGPALEEATEDAKIYTIDGLVPYVRETS